jgi:anti-sigma factor ChrR (cupin superfamily)
MTGKDLLCLHLREPEIGQLRHIDEWDGYEADFVVDGGFSDERGSKTPADSDEKEGENVVER